MRKIVNKKQIVNLERYPKEVREIILNVISILDENYGINRDIYTELGGYAIIVENLGEIKSLKEEKLQGLVAEYTDVIECSGGVNWTSSLFLLSNDFSIVVVTTEELSKYLVE